MKPKTVKIGDSQQTLKFALMNFFAVWQHHYYLIMRSQKFFLIQLAFQICCCIYLVGIAREITAI